MPVIKLKSNAVASTVQTTEQLQLGEVAINTFDGEAYYKKDDGIASIVKLLNNQDIEHRIDPRHHWLWPQTKIDLK